LVDPSRYTTGGTVQAGGGLYLTRKADDELLALCRKGSFAFVLTARQTGKSSLMTRTAERLIEEGSRIVLIDLNTLGTRLEAEQWYLGLLVEMERQLDLKTRVAAWWRQRAHLGITHRMSMFFEDVLLAEVKERMVLFVDEIDSTLSLDFTDDFFASIRSLYNARAQRPELRRLSFVLLGVATPGDLIKDPARTPFNLGHRVELTDFTFEEMRPLVVGLGLPEEQGGDVLRWVIEWTGGHPYLTQRLCHEFAQENPPPTREGVERMAARVFLGDKSFEDNNLQFVRDMLTKKERAPDVGEVLRTFRLVRRGYRVQDEEQSQVKSHLKLSGVVRREGDTLVLRNRLYRAIFSDHWIREHLPFSWRRLQRTVVSLTIVLVLLVPFTVFLWTRAGQAERDRRQAREERERARALSLTSGSRLEDTLAPTSLPRSVLLAAESVRRAPTPEGVGQLASVASLLRQPLMRLVHEGPEVAVALSPDGRTIATGSSDGNPGIWDIASGKQLARMPYGGPVNAIAFSPNGRLVATAGKDGYARIWDAASGKLLTRLEHQGQVIGLAFSPDGKAIATASRDRTARIWDAASGGHLVRMDHEDWVSAVMFSPDGKTIATASWDKTARIWDAVTGKSLARLAHDDLVHSVTFSPDGKLVATASKDGTARIWSAINGEPLVRLAHMDSVVAVAFSPDGRVVATASRDGAARVWDAASGRSLLHPLSHNGPLSAVMFSGDGRFIATASEDATARVWDAASGKLLARLAHEDWVSSVVFASDGKVLATAGWDKTVRVWSTASNLGLVRLAHPDSVLAVAFSPDGRAVATAGQDGTARVWDASDGTQLARVVHEGRVSAVTFSPDGKVVATASRDGTTRVCEVASGEPLVRLSHEGSVNAVAFSHDGKLIVTVGEDSTTIGMMDLESEGPGTVQVWDMASGRQLMRLVGHEGPVTAVAISRDDRLIATASKDKTIRVWDATRGLPLTRMVHEQAVMAVAFSPDGKAIATASDDHTARIWDVASGKQLARLIHEGPVNAVAFSPDGKVIATASSDKTVRVWDAATGSLRSRLMHEGPVHAVVFSPDGKAIATASHNRMAGVWDVATGKLLARLAHEGPVYAVAFSPDGKEIATASGDGTAFLVPWRPEGLLDAVCSRLDRNLTRDEWTRYLGEDEPYRRTCPNLPDGADVTSAAASRP
jgi:WD40 repeat protein